MPGRHARECSLFSSWFLNDGSSFGCVDMNGQGSDFTEYGTTDTEYGRCLNLAITILQIRRFIPSIQLIYLGRYSYLYLFYPWIEYKSSFWSFHDLMKSTIMCGCKYTS